MSSMTPDDLRRLLASVLPDLRRATFTGPARAGNGSVRVTVRPVELRGERLFQFAYFDGKRTTTRNCDASGFAELLAADYARIHVRTPGEEFDARISKQGKVFLGRTAVAPEPDASLAHNRAKDVPLPEGTPDRLLQVIGLQTADGRIKPTMRAKFTQINEFLKHLAHGLAAAKLNDGRELRVLDCGCGASYLTLAAHHYLSRIRKLPVRVLGVDADAALVAKSTARAAELGAENLAFVCERIGRRDDPADVVLALHACDTATDDALAQAVRCGARLVLSVPCCHHHLNAQLKADVLRPMLRHGLLRERTADIITDAARAAALRVLGYTVDVVEFVSPEHTNRNLMLRAVAGGPIGERVAADEYRALCQFWGVEPYIAAALGDRFAQAMPTRD